MGPHGRGWAKQVIPEVKEVDVVGYVDTDPNALDALREMARVPAEKCFESMKEAIAATQPQAALITTALPSHVAVTKAALACFDEASARGIGPKDGSSLAVYRSERKKG